MLGKFRRLTSPHGEREGVYKRLWTPFTSTGAFIVHPKLGKVQRPEVCSGRHLEGVGAYRWHHQPPVDVVHLCVLFMSVPLEDRMEDRHGGRGAREGGERRGEEGLLFEGLQEGLEVGASAAGRVPAVSGDHF